MDLSIPDLLQSDLSVSTASGASANFSLLPGKANVELGEVLGTVTAVGSGQVSVTTAFGDSLVLTTGSSTAYSYPSNVCAGDYVCLCGCRADRFRRPEACRAKAGWRQTR